MQRDSLRVMGLDPPVALQAGFLARSLGADRVIDYTQTSYLDEAERYDVVMDNVMNHAPSATSRVLTPNGVLLPNSIGDGRWFGALPSVAFGALFRSKQ